MATTKETANTLSLTSESLTTALNNYFVVAQDALTSMGFVVQLAIILTIYLCSFLIAAKLRRKVTPVKEPSASGAHALEFVVNKLLAVVYPMLAISFLTLSLLLGEQYEIDTWLINAVLIIAVLLFLNTVVRAVVDGEHIAAFMRWVVLPLVFLHLVGILPHIIAVLETIAVTIGNVEVSFYGIGRVLVFGVILFWLGKAFRMTGKKLIRNQKKLDVTTKEVFTKVFEVALFCVGFLLLLNIMGINLTALAVFGGALGVGLGLGLQTIASNFISGIIILVDRSLTIGDFIELEDGSKGFVREFRMRYTVLETYDGKDILVPNEKFINSLMTNWTHKDPKQRYRIDFSVAYKTDIRAMCEIIKEAVAEHPQVISGEDIPFEERPDCEIDSFGDFGVNMFVEFWMFGIDDGKNRVGGDLLLIVFETLRAHNIEIPFPQREVRILDDAPPSMTNTTPK
nr:mechanosensitive ion channel domain-containing protein [Pseudoalteromonas sp. T1lg48]